jgi:hypothetical protein
LQAGGELEDSALAFDQLLLDVFFAAAVGDVFAEDDTRSSRRISSRSVALIRSAIVLLRGS